MLVTGRSWVCCHSPDHTLTRGQGTIFLVIRAPPPSWVPVLIAWKGPRLLPYILNRNQAGVWVGREPEPGHGPGMPKKTPHPGPLSGAGQGNRPGAHDVRSPICAVTNSNYRPLLLLPHQSSRPDRQPQGPLFIYLLQLIALIISQKTTHNISIPLNKTVGLPNTGLFITHSGPKDARSRPILVRFVKKKSDITVK